MSLKTATFFAYLILFLSNLLFAQTETYPEPGLIAEFLPSTECSSSGDTFYVAIADVNGDGSFENPFNNIQSALDAVFPGDAVYIMPGTYYIDTRLRLNRDGTAEERICIHAYNLNNRPVLIRTGDINGNGVYDYESTFDIDGKMYNEYGGEVLLIRSPYYVIDGIIFDGNFAISDYYFKYVMPDGAPNEKSFRNVVVVPHYGGIPIVGTGEIPAESYLGFNGDHTIIRNCKIGKNRYDGLYVSSDSVLVENTEIHHNVRGTFTNQEDAHGIVASHLNHLQVSHCDIHHNSGDCLQVDNDVYNTSKSKLWDNIFIEHTVLWTGDLEENSGGFNIGESPGENGVDTKTFHEQTLLTHRPKIFIKNVKAYGFSQNNYISRRAVFNIKYYTEWNLDGITVYDCQLAFRIRGPYDNPLQNGAHATIKNAVAYNNGLVFRFERYVENLHIYNSTFANNTTFAEHADTPTDPAYDTNTFECMNNLFLAEKPLDASDASNIIVDESAFINVSQNNFQLTSSNNAIDKGITIAEVTTDRNGNSRPSGSAYDIGAYEHIIPTSIENKVLLKPEAFVLNQNWPNPFNPTTSISFSIPESGYVTLKVFDILGREVADLISENLDNGTYTIKFDGNQLTSGVYIYKLKTNSFIESKKMVLTK